jgi:hypothetical protein
MTNKKQPKTHTIFGVKCKYNKKSFSWKGENDQIRIELWERDITYRNPNGKRYLVEVVLRTFHQVCIDGTGNTLKEAQSEIEISLQNEAKIFHRNLNYISRLVYGCGHVWF